MINSKGSLIGTVGVAVSYISEITTQEKEVTPTIETQVIEPDANYDALSKVTVNGVTNEIDSNIKSENIKSGVSILGVEGNVVELNGEEKEVTPTKDNQVIEPSEGKNAITKVTINKIPDEYIKPTGELEITANGTYDVTEKASAVVNVPSEEVELQEKTATITANGTTTISPDSNYDGLSKAVVTVNVPEPTGTINITSNGDYNVKDKANANVNIPEPTGTLEITSNGNYNVKNKEFASVNVPASASPTLQEKSATITENGTTILTPDENYDGLSKATINVNIPAPTGSLDITANGTYDVTNKASAVVNVPTSSAPVLQEKTTTITKNGTTTVTPDSNYDGLSKNTITVNVPTKTLGTKTITENGTYNASGDNLDGYSQVQVSVVESGIDDYFINNVSSYKYKAMELIKSIPPITIESTVTELKTMFSGCISLTTIPLFDKSKVTNMINMFYNCKSLTTIPLFDASKVTSLSYMFNSCSNLESIGGFQNLGNSYLTTSSINNTSYELNLSSSTKITHDSLMNVINNLYDIATKGCKAQKLTLGTTNKAKLTAEEIAIATNKGWTVS